MLRTWTLCLISLLTHTCVQPLRPVGVPFYTQHEGDCFSLLPTLLPGPASMPPLSPGWFLLSPVSHRYSQSALCSSLQWLLLTPRMNLAILTFNKAPHSFSSGPKLLSSSSSLAFLQPYQASSHSSNTDAFPRAALVPFPALLPRDRHAYPSTSGSSLLKLHSTSTFHTFLSWPTSFK